MTLKPVDRCYLWCCKQEADPGRVLCSRHWDHVSSTTQANIAQVRIEEPGSALHRELIMKSIAEAYFTEVHHGA